MSVNMSGSWAVGLGVGVGSYQPSGQHSLLMHLNGENS